jgi:hypothetical protein
VGILLAIWLAVSVTFLFFPGVIRRANQDALG